MRLPFSEINRPHVVIVGGGITGLSAAWAMSRPKLIRDRNARVITPRITILESSDQLGGKIRTNEFAGRLVDTGPDAFLARTPSAVQLCNELGLADELVPPTSLAPMIYSRDRLRRFPSHQVLGIPASVRTLLASNVVSKVGALRAAADYTLPMSAGRAESDPTLGSVVSARLGREVLERVVDPLIGAINAGSTHDLSLAASSPQIAAMTEHHGSLMRGTKRRLATTKAAAQRSAFLAPVTGMQTIVAELEKQLGESGVDIRTHANVSALRRGPARPWSLHLDGEPGEVIEADAVLIATPSSVAADLLREVCPEAIAPLQAITYASVAVVRLAYERDKIANKLESTGYVVPSVDGKLTTASSWASSKWQHLNAPSHATFRVSVGRMGDERHNEIDDIELIAAVHKELEPVISLTGQPVDADVTRWDSSFPQYEPGHNARVTQIEHALGRLRSITVAGAAYHGLGIPACIKSAGEAAESLLAELATNHERK